MSFPATDRVGNQADDGTPLGILQHLVDGGVGGAIVDHDDLALPALLLHAVKNRLQRGPDAAAFVISGNHDAVADIAVGHRGGNRSASGGCDFHDRRRLRRRLAPAWPMPARRPSCPDVRRPAEAAQILPHYFRHRHAQCRRKIGFRHLPLPFRVLQQRAQRFRKRMGVAALVEVHRHSGICRHFHEQGKVRRDDGKAELASLVRYPAGPAGRGVRQHLHAGGTKKLRQLVFRDVSSEPNVGAVFESLGQ